MPDPNENLDPLSVRVGCKLIYETVEPTAALLCLRIRPNSRQTLVGEHLLFAGRPLLQPDYIDPHGNMLNRVELPPGTVSIMHDAVVRVVAEQDNFDHGSPAEVAPGRLPNEVLRYMFPSRYCDVDKILSFSWERFGPAKPGLPRVRAIGDWIHENIEYRFGSGSPELSAGDVLRRGYGVCRDFAHLTIAFARAMNMPARYVVGHLPDIGYPDPGTPMDFHAYAEIYLEGGWYTLDSRYNVPRIGRVTVSHGLDAADCAFTTSFGFVNLRHFEVWAYQVEDGAVTVGDPVDLSLRLDGTPRIVRSAAKAQPVTAAGR